MPNTLMENLLDLTFNFDRALSAQAIYRSENHLPLYFRQNDSNYELTLVSPGIPRNELSVEVQGRHVILEYDCKDSNSKMQWPSFRRVYAVPSDADLDKVEASYVDGVLTVILPKISSIHSTRKIAIE